MCTALPKAYRHSQPTATKLKPTIYQNLPTTTQNNQTPPTTITTTQNQTSKRGKEILSVVALD